VCGATAEPSKEVLASIVESFTADRRRREARTMPVVIPIPTRTGREIIPDRSPLVPTITITTPAMAAAESVAVIHRTSSP